MSVLNDKNILSNFLINKHQHSFSARISTCLILLTIIVFFSFFIFYILMVAVHYMLLDKKLKHYITVLNDFFV